VGAGLSTFFFTEAHTGFVSDLHDFFTAIRTAFPPGITWVIAGSGDTIDVDTGELDGTWAETSDATQTSAATGVFALGVGARVTWRTSGIRNGRRVQGSTFLVPLAALAYQSDGTIATDPLAVLNGAADALVTASTTNMVIYSRPVDALPGQANTVFASSVPDHVSWLRSRRT